MAANQNNADVQRGLGVAQLQNGQANAQNEYNLAASGAQNSYNLGTTGAQNNYNLSNYQNALQQQQLANQAQANQFGSIFGGLGLLGGGALGLYNANTYRKQVSSLSPSNSNSAPFAYGGFGRGNYPLLSSASTGTGLFQ